MSLNTSARHAARGKALIMMLALVTVLLFMLAGCEGDQAGPTDGNAGTAAVTGATTVEGAWYRPPMDATWQWQLKGDVNAGYPVEIYDIDLFDSSTALIDSLHSSGRKVICYFSAGSFESWRPDAGDFPRGGLGYILEGWADERWLDIRSPIVRRIMQQRLDLAKLKGCDGVEPDNVDGYANDSGFELSAEDQLDFNRFIAEEAHKRGLAVGLKNDLDQVDQLAGYFDFSVNEQCHEFDECDLLSPFVEAGKPVLNAEYDPTLINDGAKRKSLCDEALGEGFSTLILPVGLDDSFRVSCSE